MRIAERTLLGIGSLITLLKPAAICDSTKDTGNELGIVRQAESEKQLVVLIEIHVHTGIESVAVFLQLWIAAKF